MLLLTTLGEHVVQVLWRRHVLQLLLELLDGLDSVPVEEALSEYGLQVLANDPAVAFVDQDPHVEQVLRSSFVPA